MSHIILIFIFLFNRELHVNIMNGKKFDEEVATNRFNLIVSSDIWYGAQ